MTMAYYKIEFKPRAIKQLKKLPTDIITKVSKKIDELAETPGPGNCKKLTDSDHSYRIRTGDYRVVYSIYEQQLIIQLVKIGHRKSIYK